MTRSEFAALAILLLSLFLHLVNLNYPPDYYFDENYTAFTAVQLAQKNRPEIWLPSQTPVNPPQGYEWSHPPLARLLIASFVSLIANQSWVWRLPSVLVGTLSLLLLYLLGKKLFQTKVGLLAAFLFAFDGLSFALSRIATRDALLVLLILLSLYLAHQHKFMLSSIACGLALSTKWIAVFLVPLIIVFCYTNKKTVHNKPLTNFLWLMVLSALTYILIYLPFFALGFNFSDFLNLQKSMFQHMYHHGFNLAQAHPYNSPWWLWPFGIKPIPYYLQSQKQLWAMPNFFVFFLGLIALSWTIKSLLTHRSIMPRTIFLPLSGYFAFIFPWIILHLLSGNTKTSYLYYYLPSLPFLHLLSANWLVNILEFNSGALNKLVRLTLIVIPLIFLFIYPRLIGL